MSHLQNAFKQICPDAQAPQTRYVSLYAQMPFYGGPEEGGWWGEDTVLESYQRVRSPEEAERVKARIEATKDAMETEARRRFCEQCLRELEQAEARGIDPDELPEVDGETTFFVAIEETPGQFEERGDRHYE